VYIERDAFAASVLVARMEEKALASAPIWDDITTFDPRPWRGLVDIVAGGTPCQNLSLAGKREGLHGDRSRLFFDHVRIAVECEAPFFFWENVAGAIGVVPAVAEHLHANGYSNIAWTTLRASDVGAPHKRERVFLLAHASRFCQREPDDGQRAKSRQIARKDSGRRGVHRNAGMAHAERKGLEGHWRCGELGAGGLAVEAVRRSRCVFPPARGDVEAWASILSVRPDLAPALSRLRGLADGLGTGLDMCMCSREDRLRAAGNGVVPQQAALAWRILWGALTC
jgi:DNA (cytosine-5)-methyltransferase 1